MMKHRIPKRSQVVSFIDDSGTSKAAVVSVEYHRVRDPSICASLFYMVILLKSLIQAGLEFAFCPGNQAAHHVTELWLG
jgi:hypothetical protein